VDWIADGHSHNQPLPFNLLVVKSADFSRSLTDFREESAGALIATVSGMNPKTQALLVRTHEFFVRVIQFCDSVPEQPAARSICQQLLNSAGSTDSNYRSACKARSRREFIAKIGVAAEEADESLGWLEALHDAGLGDRSAVRLLITEANELTSIFVSSRKTATQRLEEEQRQKSAARRRTSR
jgi:four helix bundle protein